MKLGITWCYLLFMLINHKNSNLFVNGKSLENQNLASCHEHVSEFFKSFLNVTIQPSEKVGDVCGGHCCDNKTESDVLRKSIKIFEGLIKHQLKTLKSLWTSTHNTYQNHVLELSRQSENKTLSLFSTVYQRMSPLSQKPILELYKSIRSYISSEKPLHENELETEIETFFKNLFPLAYHHTIHSREANEEAMSRDFHVDYKNCLLKSYDTLLPFGEIPYSISQSLVRGVGAANVLLRSLDRGADVLAEMDTLPVDTLSIKCQHALLKMNYCAACKGHNYHHSKPCYSYCSNVMRGCLTQYIGGLDTDWASLSEAIKHLMMLVRNKDGIEMVIRGLDGRLSGAIMHAMATGVELEEKVQKMCGAPSIRHNDKIPSSYENSQQSNEEIPIDDDAPSLGEKQHTPTSHSSTTKSWVVPPDSEMLEFLISLDKSKIFSTQIANSYCEDDRYQKHDRDCWTGDHLGDYTHKVMDEHSQKYNPEVPTLLSSDNSAVDSRIRQLNDQLITLRTMVTKQMTHLSRSDTDMMYSDMAEGSAGDYDEYETEYEADKELSGDGSGDHSVIAETPIVEAGAPVDPIQPKINSNAGTTVRISSVSLTLVLSSLIVILIKQF